MPILPEKTIPYKTYIKTSLVEALREVFTHHPDARLKTRTDAQGNRVGTKVSIEYPTSQTQYPSVIIRFFERSIENMGVGHIEYLFTDTTHSYVWPFRHYRYTGDIEFGIYALTSLDRDLISDALIQALAMPDTSNYTEAFWNRIYASEITTDDFQDWDRWNYVNLNLDRILGFGETQAPAPWLAEDQLAYQTSYRVGITGEFYSLPPDIDKAFGPIEKVRVYPYETGADGLLPLPPSKVIGGQGSVEVIEGDIGHVPEGMTPS